jgi:hypothetical protein
MSPRISPISPELPGPRTPALAFVRGCAYLGGPLAGSLQSASLPAPMLKDLFEKPILNSAYEYAGRYSALDDEERPGHPGGSRVGSVR